ncbi:hypothetical protein TRAPUB_104 [Trametes pubescens]|uniref:F-box domain-containing protein n=1 Tax=Trametes pubescens TaxID=154538 RepID=A0A1M2VN40_TRAPU|nr:hypothetical protein TRAPUB_104 [Trametes pubescens]
MSTIVTVPQAVWLRPRPLARTPSSFPLLPLLPPRPALKHLPPEVWIQILENAFACYRPKHVSEHADVVRLRVGLLLISKDIHDVALPLFYAHIHVPSLRVLDKLTKRLHAADQQWDSIRRIPYSAPGRWIQSLDLSALRLYSHEDVFQLDALLNCIAGLVPFMVHLAVSPLVPLSRRALSSLGDRDGASNLRTLKGIQLLTSLQTDDDAFVRLLRSCTRLEELEIFGTGVDAAELLAEQGNVSPLPPGFRPLHLPFLRRLSVLSMPTSPTLYMLLHSPLPALGHLTLTPYDENHIPASLIPRIIATHGALLTSLYLHTVKQWPTALFPSPTTLLETCPALKHLSLELPLPTLTLSTTTEHRLDILSVARPSAEFLTVLEGLLPKLPVLRLVRARDVKWLRGGMSERAQQAGVQGEMQVWKRKLNRRGIQLLDADWKLLGAD